MIVALDHNAKVKFRAKRPMVPSGIIQPPHYFLLIYRGKYPLIDTRSTWMYCIFDTQFDKKKMEFYPVPGKRSIQIYSDDIPVWESNTPSNKIFSISKLRLEGEPTSRRSIHFKNEQYDNFYVLTNLRFDSKRITPDELIGKEKRTSEDSLYVVTKAVYLDRYTVADIFIYNKT
jgi:hypothetical protein